MFGKKIADLNDLDHRRFKRPIERLPYIILFRHLEQKADELRIYPEVRALPTLEDLRSRYGDSHDNDFLLKVIEEERDELKRLEYQIKSTKDGEETLWVPPPMHIFPKLFYQFDKLSYKGNIHASLVDRSYEIPMNIDVGLKIGRKGFKRLVLGKAVLTRS
jgi:hypothetical protein